MSHDEGWPAVKDELFRLAKDEAKDWETIQWLASVAECFDGGDFDIEDFGNLRWRLDVLMGRLNAHMLANLCQRVLDSPRTRERNGALDCGHLASDIPPRKREVAA